MGNFTCTFQKNFIKVIVLLLEYNISVLFTPLVTVHSAPLGLGRTAKRHRSSVKMEDACSHDLLTWLMIFSSGSDERQLCAHRHSMVVCAL